MMLDLEFRLPGSKILAQQAVLLEEQLKPPILRVCTDSYLEKLLHVQLGRSL